MVDTRWEGQNKPYHNIEVMAIYQNSLNTAEFWGLCLQQDAYGTSFTYDSNGNLVNSEDQAKQESSFTYSGADLSPPGGADGQFCPLRLQQRRAQPDPYRYQGGVATSFSYDEHGNPTASSTFYHPFETTVQFNKEYILINKKSSMVIDINGAGEGEDRLNKPVIQYNNKKHIYQKFIMKPYWNDPTAMVIESVYQQDAHMSNPLHLGFIEASGNTLLQMSHGDYIFRFYKNDDGSFRIWNQERGWYLGVKDGDTEANAKIVGLETYENTDGSHPEQDWYVQLFDAPAGDPHRILHDLHEQRGVREQRDRFPRTDHQLHLSGEPRPALDAGGSPRERDAVYL